MEVGSSPNSVAPTTRHAAHLADKNDYKASATARASIGPRRGGRRAELVALQAREDVGFAQALLQRSRAGQDELVARRMAEAVVDRLEAVEVEDQQRALGAMAPAEGNVLRRGSIHAAAVGMPVSAS